MRNKGKTTTEATEGQADADAVAALVTATIAEMRAQLEVVERRRLALPDEGFDLDLARVAAQLARAVASLAGEQRGRLKMEAQLAASDRHAMRKIERPTVMAWLRALSPDERFLIIGEMETWNDGRSIMG